MTNGWIDIKNTDMMLIMGGNPAENHPCGFKWPIEAKRTRNAKMIVVDPRFTRTAATADLYVPIRAGADIAFLGGLINYAIENNRIAKEYVVNYTNASFLIRDDFTMPEEDGVFSGFHADSQTYDHASWNYQGSGGAAAGMPQNVTSDPALENPRCVYQLLKKHYSRYTPEMVEKITGVPRDQFVKAADMFTSVRKDGDLSKVATIIYAVGWTQHSFGTQIIRTAAMLQLLMGNVGRAGGGVNALRGHSNIQGATDIAGIFDNLPGYLKVPTPADTDFKAWMTRTTPTSSKPHEWDSWNYYSNTSKFAVSFLKSMYGDAATKDHDWAFNYLPKVDRNYSWAYIWDGMYRGSVKGLLTFGMNGVCIGPDSQKNIDALKKAEFLVVCDIYPDETSDFWRSPGIKPEEMKQIQTEVYRLPGAGFAEKDGTFVNSARWLVWKWAAVPPPGDCRVDQEILAQIFLKLRELYRKEGGTFPDPILNLTWNYSNPQNPPLSEVAKELNGKAIADVEDKTLNQNMKAGQQLPGFSWLRDDGSTASGNWIWCGSWTEAGALTQRRGTEDPSGLGIYPGWAWSWPMNRRVLYNRASCDVSGKPWDPTRKQVWWNEAQKKWVGNDVPDFKVDSKPEEHMGPFIMNAERASGRLFTPLAAWRMARFRVLRTHGKSRGESTHPKQKNNPVVKKFSDGSRQTRHQTDGIQRGVHHVPADGALSLLDQEQSNERAACARTVCRDSDGVGERDRHQGRRQGEGFKRACGTYIAKAMVTHRIRPMMLNGEKLYQIGIPLHFGYRGIQEDEGKTERMLVNSLSPVVVDPNANTPEFKGFLVKVEKA